jgi:hypothetical protein
MSGGYIYGKGRINDIAEKIQTELVSGKKEGFDDPELNFIAREAVRQLKRTWVFVDAIDLLVSGDTDKTSFLKTLVDELAEVTDDV